MAIVLVVDDDEILRGLLAEVLVDAGHTVYTACDGQAALQVLKVLSIDILISDLRMPIMSGRELLARVHRHYPNMPVIAVSGDYSSNNTMPDGVIAHKFYVKGQSGPSELLQAIDSLLKESRSLRGKAESG